MIARHMMIGWSIYLALVAQPGMVELARVGSWQPWLPGIALVACLGLTCGSARLAWAAILGLGVDCLSADRLGVHFVLATLVACLLSTFWFENRSGNLIAVTASVMSGTFLWKFAAAASHATLSRVAFDPQQSAITSLGDAVYSSIVTGSILLVGTALIKSIRPERDGAVSLKNRWSMLSEH